MTSVVAHEERDVGDFRRLDQACCFVHRIRDRFLDQHWNAVLYTQVHAARAGDLG